MPACLPSSHSLQGKAPHQPGGTVRHQWSNDDYKTYAIVFLVQLLTLSSSEDHAQTPCPAPLCSSGLRVLQWLTSQQEDEGLGGDLQVGEGLIGGGVLGAEQVTQEAAGGERSARPARLFWLHALLPSAHADIHLAWLRLGLTCTAQAHSSA